MMLSPVFRVREKFRSIREINIVIDGGSIWGSFRLCCPREVNPMRAVINILQREQKKLVAMGIAADEQFGKYEYALEVIGDFFGRVHVVSTWHHRCLFFKMGVGN